MTTTSILHDDTNGRVLNTYKAKFTLQPSSEIEVGMIFVESKTLNKSNSPFAKSIVI